MPNLDRFAVGFPDPQEEEVVGECIGCGGEIYKGDDVYDFGGDMIHQDSSCCMDYVANASILRAAGD